MGDAAESSACCNDAAGSERRAGRRSARSGWRPGRCGRSCRRTSRPERRAARRTTTTRCSVAIEDLFGLKHLGYAGPVRPAVLRQGRLHEGWVGARPVEHVAVPAARREQHRAGIVLPHPPGEVPPGPRRERRGADGSTRAERDAQHVLEQRREPEVGAEGAVDVGAVARRVRRRATKRSARAASIPLSSACAMPSPVIGSTTLAASPANSTRPRVSRSRSYAAGMGHARTVPSGSACGPSARRRLGRSASPRHCAASALPLGPPSVRSTPKPTLARPSPTGNTHA